MSPHDPVGDHRCNKNLQAMVDYTKASVFALEPRDSTPYCMGSVVRHPLPTEPIVAITVQLVETFVTNVSQPTPIVDAAATGRRWLRTRRSQSPAVRWLNGDDRADPSHDGDDVGGSTATQPPPNDIGPYGLRVTPVLKSLMRVAVVRDLHRLMRHPARWVASCRTSDLHRPKIDHCGQTTISACRLRVPVRGMTS